MNKVSEILSYITEVAPIHWQESYDNSGLLIGDANALVDKVLLTLDLTEKVIDEAIENSFHLVISHHPLIFKGLKNILVDDTTGRIITKAIKHDISIAAMHTNIDNSFYGVNRVLAEQLGLKNLQILRSQQSAVSSQSTGNNIRIKEVKNERSVCEKHAHGIFNNIYLTDDEYKDYRLRVREIDAVIDELSESVAANPSKYRQGEITAWLNKFIRQKYGRLPERRKLLNDLH